jgi:hypothetical protein
VFGLFNIERRAHGDKKTFEAGDTKYLIKLLITNHMIVHVLVFEMEFKPLVAASK